MQKGSVFLELQLLCFGTCVFPPQKFIAFCNFFIQSWKGLSLLSDGEESRRILQTCTSFKLCISLIPHQAYDPLTVTCGKPSNGKVAHLINVQIFSRIYFWWNECLGWQQALWFAMNNNSSHDVSWLPWLPGSVCQWRLLPVFCLQPCLFIIASNTCFRLLQTVEVWRKSLEVCQKIIR